MVEIRFSLGGGFDEESSQEIGNAANVYSIFNPAFTANLNYAQGALSAHENGSGYYVIYNSMYFVPSTAGFLYEFSDYTGSVNFTGSNFGDVIRAGSGTDALDGGAGDDHLDGGVGADTMKGGADDDGYTVDNAGDIVIEAVGGGSDTLFTSVSYALAVAQEIEKLAVADASGTTAVNIDGNEFAQTITGNAGVNVLNGLGAADVLDGGAGADILDGGTGADIMDGGIGDDIFYADDSADRVIEAAGSENGTDAVFSSANLGLTAGTAVETLATGQKSGTQAINLTGNAFAQSIAGNNGVNILNGQAGNDRISGNGDGDRLFGDRGNDVLDGGSGNDRLFGGIGNDTLIGGAGNDLFFFDSRANAATNHDTIADFSNVLGNDDIIYLFSSIYTTLTAGALGGAFAANATGLAEEADDRVIYNAATGDLFYDVNGSAAGGSILFASLNGAPTITENDFMVI